MINYAYTQHCKPHFTTDCNLPSTAFTSALSPLGGFLVTVHATAYNLRYTVQPSQIPSITKFPWFVRWIPSLIIFKLNCSSTYSTFWQFAGESIRLIIKCRIAGVLFRKNPNLIKDFYFTVLFYVNLTGGIICSIYIW